MKKEEKEKLKKLIESLVVETIKEESLLTEGDDVIYKAFIEPFKDVIDTATHGVKSTVTTVGSGAKKLSKMMVIGTLFPMIAAVELDSIEKESEARLDKYISGLDDQYKDVLKRNLDSMQTRDAKYFSFFLRPDLFFAKQIAVGSPIVALDLLDTLTLGNERVRSLKKRFQNLYKTTDHSGGGPLSGGGGMGAGGGYVDYDLGDGGLEEALDPKQKLSMKKEIEELLKDPKIIAAMKNNKIIQGIAKIQTETVLDRANKIAKANTFDDIKKILGQEANKMEAKAKEEFPEGTTPEEEKKLLDGMVPEIKKMYEEIYKKYLTDFLKLDNLYPKDMQQAINKIDQLA